jgi:heme exporter protein A
VPADDDTRLAFTDLHRRFGPLRVLTGVSGEVGPGEVLLVTGTNGSGKSTLLKVLAGLLAPERGEVVYREGGASLDIAARRRAVGFVAPDLALYEELTTLENLLFFCRLRGVPEARAGELLDRVGLPHDRPAGALSSGMRQRLRWTWALLARPRLLLLDEPFQNLDAPGVAQGTELLESHLAGGGIAVVANPGALEVPSVGARLDLDRAMGTVAP